MVADKNAWKYLCFQLANCEYRLKVAHAQTWWGENELFPKYVATNSVVMFYYPDEEI